MGGAWTIRWGQPLWEASIAAGRASNASGSCSPERFRLVFPEVYFYGETSRESGKSGAGPFLLIPCLDEPSFLRERKVSRGWKEARAFTMCYCGLQPVGSQAGERSSPCAYLQTRIPFLPLQREGGRPQGCAKCPLVSRGARMAPAPAPKLKGVGSAAYPCPLSDRSAPLRVLKALNGGF